ncbi:MAG TPA: glycosyltransferase [Acidimicrobiales bacterium]|nr:glycosyltransferase [Acidimicrobiales bacterium]
MLSVVMPAHNEEQFLAGAVERVVDELRRRGDEFEVIVVENGSSDATAEVAARLCAAIPEVRAMGSGEADYGRALRAGFLAAHGDRVVNYDVDLVDVVFLSAAEAVMASEGAAIVVGSKRSEGADDGRNAARRTVTAVFSLVLRLGFGLRVSDTHGCKLLDRTALLDVVAACEFGADIFDTELVLRAERRGLRVAEVPVAVRDARPPRTPIARRIPRSLLGLGRLRLRLWRQSA